MRQNSWTISGAESGSSPAALDHSPLLLLLLAVGFVAALVVKGVTGLRRSKRDRERWGDAH